MGRRALRLLLLVLSPALLLVLLEIGLRLGGYGYPTGFFIGPDENGAYTTNCRFGWRFFPRPLARDPRPCTLRPKPAGTVRIFILGESAAMGIPDPAYGFGRMLSVMLRERFPGKRFEVVNAAMVAINSHAVREIARDCAALDPDLFVVCMGNNEVIGPYGPGTVFQRWSPNPTLIRAAIAARAARIGQLLDRAAAALPGKKSQPESWRGMAMFTGNPVPADDRRLGSVYGSFRRNLGEICDVARRARAGVVLLTVPVNLRDCPPFGSQHRGDLSPANLAAWTSAYQAGAELEASNRWPEAAARYEAAAAIDDRFAELQFRTARCLEKTGRPDEADARFARALDLDTLRFRTDSRIDAAIREVADARKSAGVRLADARRLLSQRSAADGSAAPDAELFYEHVHMTFAGNYRLARAAFAEVQAALPGLGSAGEPSAVPSRERCAELLAFTPWDEFRLAQDMTAMTSVAPFTLQLEHSRRQAEACRRRDELGKRAATPESLEASQRSYERALAAAPDDAELHRSMATFAIQRGRFDEASEHLQKAVADLPMDGELYNLFGVTLAGRRQTDEAIVYFRKALELRPDFADVHNNLGLALIGRGRYEEAIEHYRKALAANPDYVEAHANLAMALLDRGAPEDAIAHFRRIAELRPDAPEPLNNLGLALTRLGRVDEAMENYRRALAVRTDCADAHVNLGDALTARGKIEEAIAHYRQALEIEPGHAKAHNNLGFALANRGQTEEAVEHYRKALELVPNYADAHNNLGMALAAAGQIDEAITHYRKALEFKPDCAEAHNNLGVALASGRGAVAEAVTHFEKAVEIKPDYQGARQNLERARSLLRK